MEWLPAVSAEVERIAAPPLSVFVPRTVVPFLNVTVPVGVPDNVGLTTAVNLTALPEGEGFADEDRLVVVAEVIEKLADSLFSTLPATSVL